MYGAAGLLLLVAVGGLFCADCCGLVAVDWSLRWSVALSVCCFIRGIVGRALWIGGFMSVALSRLLWVDCCCLFALGRSMWVGRSGLGALGRLLSVSRCGGWSFF